MQQDQNNLTPIALTPVAIDFETCPIDIASTFPRAICLSLAELGSGEVPETHLIGNDDPAAMEALLRALFEDDTIRIVAHQAAFDMGVACRTFPALVPLVWRAYEKERVSCTIVRERILNISDFGGTDEAPLPDGSWEKIKYGLVDLAKRYLGVDRTEAKEGQDIWRLHYQMLDGKPASEYPIEAAQYAKDDAADALGVFLAQEKRKRGSTGPCSIGTEALRCGLSFALALVTERGMAIDPEQVRAVEEELARITSDENLQILYTSEIMRPAEPPRPHKRRARPKITWHVDDLTPGQRRELLVAACAEVGTSPEYGGTNGDSVLATIPALSRMLGRALECFEAEGVAAEAITRESTRGGFPNFSALLERAEILEGPGDRKMTAGKKASVNRKALSELVRSLRASVGLPLVWTKSSQTKGPDPFADPDEEAAQDERTHSTVEEVVEEVAHLSPVLAKYVERNAVTKLLTTELPRLRDSTGQTAPVVRFNFSVPVNTGRTSSFGGDLYPSANGQNIDPRMRPCYVARPGHLLCSIDYSSIELVSAAETCLRLFQRSKLAEIIVAGKDPHAYLGCSIALRLEPSFRETCARAPWRAGALPLDEAYEIFLRCKTDGEEVNRAFFKKFRTLAKPTGLGYWGGLGPTRFVAYAKAQYGVDVTEETARTLKDVWFETFAPDPRSYFDWIRNSLRDPSHPIIGYDDYQKPIDGYAYQSPLGMWRARCQYTEACNGFALQTPTADGASVAVWSVVRACHDPAEGNQALLGCRPVDFLHDEILLEIPDDDWAHDRVHEAAQIMREAMRVVFPSLPIKAEPALMRRWHKEAEPVFNEHGRLIPWEPKQ